MDYGWVLNISLVLFLARFLVPSNATGIVSGNKIFGNACIPEYNLKAISSIPKSILSITFIYYLDR